jgi:cystathionine beta-lyase
MSRSDDTDHREDDTRVVHAGRHPERQHGAVNTPVYRASTILSPDMADWERKKRDRVAGAPGVYYGRFGTPTTHAFEEAVAELEGGARCVLYPSGLAACVGALQAFLATGDHALIVDTVYGPTRNFANRVLKRFGVEITFYDPSVGGAIDALLRPNTRVVFVESPGSLTFEVQDVPAIAAAAHRYGALVLMDNTWATPLYFKPFEHGVDVSVQAATKYLVGHSDALLGTVTCTAAAWPRLRAHTYDSGQTAGPDDVYLAQRGLRTLAVRLERHFHHGVALAQWLSRQPEVARVLHPALQEDPGNALWKRDFRGASGLFGVVLQEGIRMEAMAALLDALELFGIGASWGGYESLVMPVQPAELRSATRWPYGGPMFRVHAGLEALEDLRADLEGGFARLRASL